MDDFIAWYCSGPRLAFNKTVVLRYKLQLESRHLASSTINLRLAAVRRLAYEAVDTGLPEPRVGGGHSPSERGPRNWMSAWGIGSPPRRPKSCCTAPTSRPSRASAVEPSWRSVSAVASSVRVGAPDGGATAKKGRTLGHRRPDRQGISERFPFRIGSNHPWTLERRQRNLQRPSLSLCE
jgi:hypothetical protein